MDWAGDSPFVFSLSLKQKPNKASLRELSRVLRLLPSDPISQNAPSANSNVAESVSKAKEAVQMDVTDGESWCKTRLSLNLDLNL